LLGGKVGVLERITEGLRDGTFVGSVEGGNVDDLTGNNKGALEGRSDGLDEGDFVGVADVTKLRNILGLEVGIFDGGLDGYKEGLLDGNTVGEVQKESVLFEVLLHDINPDIGKEAMHPASES